MFADDFSNCAETVNLPRQTEVIDQFCLSTGMELNLNKTVIIVFRIFIYQRTLFFFRGQQMKITQVYQYMYMGLLFTPTLSWTAVQHKLAIQAQKAIYHCK